MPRNIRNTGAVDYLIDSARALEPITKADATPLPDGDARGIWCGTAGTLNFVDGAGETRANFPLQVGPNMIIVQQVHTGGTAADLWAIY